MRRSRSPSRTSGDFAAAFAAEHRRLYGYVHEQRPLEVVAARVEAIGRSRSALCRARHGSSTHRPPAARAAIRCASRRPSASRRSTTATNCQPGADHRRPGDHRRAAHHHHRRSRLASRRALRRRTAADATHPIDSWLTTRSPASRHIAHTPSSATHRRRPRPARSLQQPLHRHRHADGDHAPQHVDEREREGAARLQLRDLHARGRPGRQRAAHSRAPRRDGPDGEADHRRQPAMQPGDVFVTNDPYRGGSHLPDVTVVTPVFDSATDISSALSSPPAGPIMPKSAASRPARCRRSRRTWPKKAC